MSARLYDAAGKLMPSFEERALARARHAAAAQLGFIGEGGYQGARSNLASMRNWSPTDGNADSDLLGDLSALRARSRDLWRNDPTARAVVETTIIPVVGEGLSLQASVDATQLRFQPERAQRENEAVEWVWNAVADRLDWSEKQSLTDMLETVLRSTFVDGDILLIRRFDETDPVMGTRVQMVAGNRLCTPPNLSSRDDVIAGVEVDARGRQTAFYVANEPSRVAKILRGSRLGSSVEGTEVSPGYVRVPAFIQEGNLRMGAARLVGIHAWPDETRSAPLLAPIIEPLKQLKRYKDSELMAAVVSSFFTVFVKTEGGQGLANETLDAAGNPIDTNTNRNEYALTSGGIVGLRPGEDISTADPKRPNERFDGFVTAVLKDVGSAMGIPLEVLTKNFQASYSASRAALLEAWRHFRRRRAWLIGNVLGPIYEWVIEEGAMRGYVSPPRFFLDPSARRAYLRANWHGPVMGQLDPAKEVEAYKEMDELGVTSLTRVTAELLGEDYESVLIKRKEERELRTKYGEPEKAAPKSPFEEDGDVDPETGEPKTDPSDQPDTEKPENT